MGWHCVSWLIHFLSLLLTLLLLLPFPFSVHTTIVIWWLLSCSIEPLVKRHCNNYPVKCCVYRLCVAVTAVHCLSVSLPLVVLFDDASSSLRGVKVDDDVSCHKHLILRLFYFIFSRCTHDSLPLSSSSFHSTLLSSCVLVIYRHSNVQSIHETCIHKLEKAKHTQLWWISLDVNVFLSLCLVFFTQHNT